MGWVVAGVWIGAVLLSAVVLGFCIYELVWKSRRLQSDLERLNQLAGTLAGLQGEIQTVQRRVSDVAG